MQLLVLVLAGSAQTDSSSDPSLIQQLIDQGWIGAGEVDGEHVWLSSVPGFL